MKTQSSATLSEETKAAIAAHIRETANADHEQFPQYLNHWDGSEWQVVALNRTVHTKLGVAFFDGELTLARVEVIDGQNSVTAYSSRNRIDTLVSTDAVCWL